MKNILKRVDKVTKTHIYNAYTHEEEEMMIIKIITCGRICIGDYSRVFSIIFLYFLLFILNFSLLLFCFAGQFP